MSFEPPVPRRQDVEGVTRPAHAICNTGHATKHTGCSASAINTGRHSVRRTLGIQSGGTCML
eukprot:CAMPEP_0170405886 /NCGR_PEP_ID=MMETSP0117_2-20130122/27423_1 /TAXON_ID=400756 /ORGANISM="Durinskia baltica, Strain CSIRO CS-38" /LENGTH=61 /DNA_ID=CAMNT_0010663037 /DNA_START=90 /DNA_END=272 /DNA_ORIENTATION=+